MKKFKFLIPIVIFGLISAGFVAGLIFTATSSGLDKNAIPGIIMMAISIGLLALFIVLRVNYLKKHADEIRADNEQRKQIQQELNVQREAEKAFLKQYRATRSVPEFGIDEIHKLVSIQGFTRKTYRYTDIAGYNVLRREQNTTKGNTVGRAVVGGAVAGVVGAAVGATSALETKTQSLLAVDIAFANGGHQTIYILNTAQPVSTTVFINSERKLNEIVAMLDIIVNENNSQ